MSAPAAAVEFMHTATLLHDDVVDESDRAAAARPARLVWGNQASVLVGDFLLGQAFRMHGGRRLAAGPQDPVQCRRRDRRGRGDAARRRQEHLDHRGRLSGDHRRQDGGTVLGRAEVGAAHRRPARRRAGGARSYGRNLGIAFQLVDDALD